MTTIRREVKVRSFVCRVEDLPSGRHLEARVQEMGEDLVVAVGGGEWPQVGSVVPAQPDTLSTGSPARSRN
jgi:predicted flavoprotein YhiN